MEDLLRQVATEVQQRYYGKYRGFVQDVEDPENRARLRLTVPSVLGEAVTGWALPCLPFGGLQDQGFFSVPEIGAQVWVEFEEGELSHPIWTGTFWQVGGDVPEEAAISPPTTRILKTPQGNRLQFDDEPDAEKALLHHASGSEIELDEDGRVNLTDEGGSTVVLDAAAGTIEVADSNGNSLVMSSSGTTVEDSNGNRIEMGPSGVKIKGQQIVIEGTQVSLGGAGGEPIIKGSSFLTLFATHIHPTSAPGAPTAPPIPQGEMSSLSATVTTT